MSFKLKDDNPCPSCGTKLDGATGVLDDTPRPKEGDLSVCAYCYTILQFDADLKSQIVTPDDFLELPVEIRGQLKSAQQTLKDFPRG